MPKILQITARQGHQITTMDRESFVTLTTNDNYALGCLVLANSLRRVGTTRRISVMVTPGVSQEMRMQLHRVFDYVHEVDLLDSEDPVNLQLLGRPDLNVTFTKLHCWRLVQYTKCVFLDADTMVIQNVDDLFDREEFSAAPDAGWPDCFNSGVFVFCPSEQMYQTLLQFAITNGSFDGGDQGLLNSYFSDWATTDISKHLPFTYNVVSQAFYSYLPAFTRFKKDVKIVHFIGAVKPWHHTYNTDTQDVTLIGGSGHNVEYINQWWEVFSQSFQPLLEPNSNSASFAALSLSPETPPKDYAKPPAEMDDHERKLAWERGHADYMGVDAFEHIQRKLDETIRRNSQGKSRDPISGHPPASTSSKPKEKSKKSTSNGSDKSLVKEKSTSKDKVQPN